MERLHVLLVIDLPEMSSAGINTETCSHWMIGVDNAAVTRKSAFLSE